MSRQQRRMAHAVGIYLVAVMAGVLLLSPWPLAASTLAGGSYVVAFVAGMLTARPSPATDRNETP